MIGIKRRFEHLRDVVSSFVKVSQIVERMKKNKEETFKAREYALKCESTALENMMKNGQLKQLDIYD